MPPRSPRPSRGGTRSSWNRRRAPRAFRSCVIRAPLEWLAHRAGSAPGQPAGHRPGAYRRRSGTGLRTGAAAVRRHPRPVLHPRRRRPDRGPDPGRARRGCARRYPPERLRARVHLRRGQRRLPQRLCRPRQPSRAGTSGGSAGRCRHRGQQPPQRVARASWPRSPPAGGTAPGSRVRLPHLLRIERPVGAARRLRHERIGCLRPHDDRGNPGRAPVSRHLPRSTTTSPATWGAPAPPRPWSSAPPREARGTSPST